MPCELLDHHHHENCTSDQETPEASSGGRWPTDGGTHSADGYGSRMASDSTRDEQHPDIDPSDVETVERFIAAPASAIFALVADPARHPEIDGSGTVRKATSGGGGQMKLGSRFGMSMKAGIPYSMVSEVIEFEQDRRIAWQTKSPIAFMGLFVGGRIWRYELEPATGGTLVRESWDISEERVKAMVRPMRRRTRQAMTSTLERIATIVTG